MTFFRQDFAESVREFSRQHDDMNVRVEVVTLTGERLDTLQMRAIEAGTRLSTRDDRLVFLPYPHIAYVDLSALQDHRIVGFQLSTTPE